MATSPGYPTTGVVTVTKNDIKNLDALNERLIFFINNFEERENRKPKDEEMLELINLAYISLDPSKRSDRLIKLMPSLITAALGVIFFVIFLFSIIGIQAGNTLAYFTGFLKSIPEDAWDVIKIIFGFWFGGSVGSGLIDKWKGRE